METANTGAWFERWFDSPYYHTLYKHRDEEEARYFIENLIRFLKPSAHAEMLDVACGRGRHSIFLNQLGFNVTGIDLSPSSIEFASQFAKPDLRFEMHDMRNTLCSNVYDYVINLFTSFGYFESDYENLRAIDTMATALKKGGILIMDYLNAGLFHEKTHTIEEKSIDGSSFTIKRKIEGNFVFKEIEVQTADEKFLFNERVELLYKQDFERYFKATGLVTTACFGDYDLSPFHLSESKRLILIARKQ
jgi:SAM-dependent methyltransferase